MRELLGPRPGRVREPSASATRSSPTTRGRSTFLIADGVLPSNEGRGYVLRRILRRAVRHGRLLGRREPFLAETAAVVIDVMGEAYPHLVDAARGDPRRRSPARRRSSRGRSTPARSCSSGDRDAARRRPRRPGRSAGGPRTCPPTRRVLPGDVAFRLHDTYGFPIDLTVELAAEYGVAVDRDGVRGRPRRAARAQPLGHEGRAVAARRADRALRRDPGPRRRHAVPRLRDDDRRGPGRRDRPRRDGVRRADRPRRGRGRPRPDAVLRRGRRPGRRPGRPARAGRRERAVHASTDTQKPLGGLIVHRGTLHGRLRVGETVEAVVDAERRADTMRNHTGTHLLHRALRNVVGERARQAGSLVTPGLPALRLPVRPGADRRGAARDRGRGPPHHPRRPARHRGVHDDGGGDRGAAPTPSSTRSTARRSGRSASRATASSCAAARIAAPPARSAAS